MGFSADAIANEFLNVAERNGETLTPMKLQKLAYFSHGWFLALEKKPFVDEPIYAWKFGPVIQSMYHEFKEFGDSPITRKARELRIKKIPDSRRVKMEVFEPQFATESLDEAKIRPEDGHALIRRIWELYGDKSALQLSNATHASGTPWREIYDSFSGNIPHGIQIPDDMIQTYFTARLKK